MYWRAIRATVAAQIGMVASYSANCVCANLFCCTAMHLLVCTALRAASGGVCVTLLRLLEASTYIILPFF